MSATTRNVSGGAGAVEEANTVDGVANLVGTMGIARPNIIGERF